MVIDDAFLSRCLQQIDASQPRLREPGPTTAGLSWTRSPRVLLERPSDWASRLPRRHGSRPAGRAARERRD